MGPLSKLSKMEYDINTTESIAKYIFVSNGGEIMDAFTEEELRFLAELRMWPPRRSPWTAEELRNLLKIARITFPEAFENINQEV